MKLLVNRAYLRVVSVILLFSLMAFSIIKTSCFFLFDFSIGTNLWLNLIELVLFFTFYFSANFKKIVVFDFLLLFVFFFFLYNFTFYLFYNVCNTTVFDISTHIKVNEKHIKQALRFVSISFSVLIQFITFYKLFSPNTTEYSISLKMKEQIALLKESSMRLPFLLLIILFFNWVALDYVINFIVNDGFYWVSIISDRATLTNKIGDGTNLWFLKYSLVSYTCSLILFFYVQYKRMSYRYLLSLIILNIPILLFWFISMKIGHRRELVYLVIFIFGIYLTNSKIKQLRLAIYGLVLMTFTLIWGLYRMGLDFNVETKFLFTNILGDFVIPHHVLIYYFSVDSIDHLFGLSYIMFPIILIPRVLWLAKPNLLGTQFVIDHNLEIGFGYSPLLESYVNFGWAAIVLFPIMIIVLYNFVARTNFTFPFLYLFLYMQVLNINRGESSAFLIEILVIYSIFLFIYKVIYRK